MTIDLKPYLLGVPEEIVNQLNADLEIDVSKYAAHKIIFRPGDPSGARGNVYVDWVEAYSAVQASRSFGPLELEFDTTFAGAVSGVTDITGDNAILLPAGNWDFNKVMVSTPRTFSGHTVATDDNCFITNLNIINGHNLTLFNKSTVTSPHHGFLHCLIMGGNITYIKVAPGAKPFFVVDDTEVTPGFGIIYSPYELGQCGYSNEGEDPVLDVNGNTGVLGGFRVFDNTVADLSEAGNGTLIVGMYGSVSASFMQWNFPAMPNTTTITLDNSGGWTGVSDHSRYLILNTTPVTGTYNATFNELVPVDTSGAVTVTLPQGKGPLAERVTVVDATGDASSNNITVTTSVEGQTINGESSFTMNVDNSNVTFVCFGNGNWIALI